MIFLLYLLSWMIWSLLASTCRFKYAPRPLNQRLDKKCSKTNRPVFCYWFGSGAWEITLGIQKGAFPLQKRTENVIFYSESDFPCAREITLEIQKGAFPLQKRTENVFFYSESDFSCARAITLGIQKGVFLLQKRTENIILLLWFPLCQNWNNNIVLRPKCKQKHDLLLGVVYPFKQCILKVWE